LSTGDFTQISKHDDIHFFVVDALTNANLPAGFLFVPGQNYVLETRYRVAGNFEPPSPTSFVVDDVKHDSRITNHLYFSSHQPVFTVPSFSIATPANPLNPQPDQLYFCEAWDGRHAFMSIDDIVSQHWRNGTQIGAWWEVDPCDKAMDLIQVVRVGGGMENWFPHEFRPAPGVPLLFHLEMPPYALPEVYSPQATMVSTEVQVYATPAPTIVRFDGPLVAQGSGIPFVDVGDNAFELDLHSPPLPAASLNAYGTYPWVFTEADCSPCTGSPYPVASYPLPVGDELLRSIVHVEFEHECGYWGVDPVRRDSSYVEFPDYPWVPSAAPTGTHRGRETSPSTIFVTSLFQPLVVHTWPSGNSATAPPSPVQVDIDLSLVTTNVLVQASTVQNGFIRLTSTNGMLISSVTVDGFTAVDMSNGLYWLGELNAAPNHVHFLATPTACLDGVINIAYGYYCDPLGTGQLDDMVICFEEHTTFTVIMTNVSLVDVTPVPPNTTEYGYCQPFTNQYCFQAPDGPVGDLDFGLNVPAGMVASITGLNIF
ncbi:MAG TPA: hypothetical protein VKG92_11720, partial [Flavobacteriales bacterium]|nr:hypothetical protein [Flavobacteriales bacterium]